MTPPPSLSVIIFHDPSVLSHLGSDSPLFEASSPRLIVEFSAAPILASGLDLDTPAAYPGPAGLLSPDSVPSDLAIACPALACPAILAPGRRIGLSVLGAVLRRLGTDVSLPSPTVALVDAKIAPALAPWLAYCSRLGVAVDLGLPFTAELASTLTALDNESLLDPVRWSGFSGYFSDHHHPTEVELASASKELRQFPGGRLLESSAIAKR